MLHLISNSLPDIAFAVHQAAIFTNCTRLINEKYINQIGMCLKHTHYKGLIMAKHEDMNPELSADADLCGLWKV